MAQTPWEVLSVKPLSEKEVASIASSCARDISKYSAKRSQWQSLIENLSTFAQTVTAFSLEDDHQSSSLTRNSFSEITAQGTIQLHPRYLGSVRMGIRAYLCNFLLKYLPEFHGVWLAYHPSILQHDSVGFQSEADKMAIITFQVQLRCLVFRPSPRTYLVGIVSQIRDTHIALLVNGIFSACIRRDELDHRYRYVNNVYVPKNEGTTGTVRPQSLVMFQVLRCRHTTSGEIMSIEGSVKDVAHCGALARSSSHDLENPVKPLMSQNEVKLESPMKHSEQANHTGPSTTTPSLSQNEISTAPVSVKREPTDDVAATVFTKRRKKKFQF